MYSVYLALGHAAAACVRENPAAARRMLLDMTPEGQLARELVDGEHLRGPFAETLLQYARDLAVDRLRTAP